jgi:acyl-CoA thioesterase FadM
MNLIWRLIRMWIAAHLGARADVMGEARLAFRCLPTDLDIFVHMTNSRYASFGDLSRVSFMIRNGTYRRLRKAGYLPVLSSVTFRFRRPIGLFERFTVSTSVLTWDDRYVYLLHKYETAKDMPAIAVVKAAFIGRQGRPPIGEVIALMGYAGPKPESPIAKEVTDLDLVLKA